MRVIGSHAISTSWPGSRFTCDGSRMVVVIELLSLIDPLRHKTIRCFQSPIVVRAQAFSLPGTGRAGIEFGARMPPARLLVDGPSGDMPQAADHRAVQSRHRRGDVG